MDGALADLDEGREPLPVPSVLRALNVLHRRLDIALAHLRDDVQVGDELRSITRELLRCVDTSADVALACVLLNQIAGNYAVRHCIETAVVCAVVGRHLALPEGQLLSLAAAALTMNAAMLGEHTAFQERAALSGEERARLRGHPHDSARLLSCAGIEDDEWLSCVLLHHELDDGSGYPHGRPGHEIPAGARLLRVADRYCARISARNYRRSLLPDQAMAQATGEAGATLAAAFAQGLGSHPPGTLVRLDSGATGVVAHAGTSGRDICCLRGPDGAPVDCVLVRDTEEGCRVTHALSEDDADLRFAMQRVWGPLAAL